MPILCAACSRPAVYYWLQAWLVRLELLRTGYYPAQLGKKSTKNETLPVIIVLVHDASLSASSPVRQAVAL